MTAPMGPLERYLAARWVRLEATRAVRSSCIARGEVREGRGSGAARPSRGLSTWRRGAASVRGAGGGGGGEGGGGGGGAPEGGGKGGGVWVGF